MGYKIIIIIIHLLFMACMSGNSFILFTIFSFIWVSGWKEKFQFDRYSINSLIKKKAKSFVKRMIAWWGLMFQLICMSISYRMVWMTFDRYSISKNANHHYYPWLRNNNNNQNVRKTPNKHFNAHVYRYTLYKTGK